MTTKHNFEVGKAYQTRDGRKAVFIGNGVLTKKPIFEVAVVGLGGCLDVSNYYPPEEIIGIWEDEPEQIDVGQMWVAIVRHKTNGSIIANRRMYKERPANLPADTIAFIRVHEWEAIKRGERKLIKGEGL